MRVRFRAVATDAATGDLVILGGGDLARAIRASMAVPAVFAGVDINGRLLIDGAVFDFGVAYEARAINELNGKWRTEFQLGQSTLLATEIYQPLDPADYWFANARVDAFDPLRKRYVNNQAESEYGIARTGVPAALGANVDRYGDVRTGFRRYVGHTRLAVDERDPYPRYQFDEVSVFVSTEFENFDSIRFPRSGGRLLLTALAPRCGKECVRIGPIYLRVGASPGVGSALYLNLGQSAF